MEDINQIIITKIAENAEENKGISMEKAYDKYDNWKSRERAYDRGIDYDEDEEEDYGEVEEE